MRADEEKEFLVTQYIDGMLSPAQCAELEERLKEDGELRDLLEEHRRLDEFLSSALPISEIQWDSLARNISAAVSKAPMPARNYRLRIWGSAAAVAACILIAITLQMRTTSRAPQPISAPPAIVAQAEVTGPQTESIADDSYSSVQISAPSMQVSELVGSTVPVVVEPSHVFIASAAADEHPVH